MHSLNVVLYLTHITLCQPVSTKVGAPEGLKLQPSSTYLFIHAYNSPSH